MKPCVLLGEHVHIPSVLIHDPPPVGTRKLDVAHVLQRPRKNLYSHDS